MDPAAGSPTSAAYAMPTGSATAATDSPAATSLGSQAGS
jgi:hypothetical protein